MDPQLPRLWCIINGFTIKCEPSCLSSYRVDITKMLMTWVVSPKNTKWLLIIFITLKAVINKNFIFIFQCSLQQLSSGPERVHTATHANFGGKSKFSCHSGESLPDDRVAQRQPHWRVRAFGRQRSRRPRPERHGRRHPSANIASGERSGAILMFFLFRTVSKIAMTPGFFLSLSHLLFSELSRVKIRKNKEKNREVVSKNVRVRLKLSLSYLFVNSSVFGCKSWKFLPSILCRVSPAEWVDRAATFITHFTTRKKPRKKLFSHVWLFLRKLLRGPLEFRLVLTLKTRKMVQLVFSATRRKRPFRDITFLVWSQKQKARSDKKKTCLTKSRSHSPKSSFSTVCV